MTSTSEYLENQVLTASPHRLHLLVIDGAIRYARQGLAAMHERRWEAMEQDLDRARECVTELIGGLNATANSELADQIKSLFMFSYRNLIAGELERSPQRIEDAIHILNLHRETWVELGRKLQSDASAAVIRQLPPAPHVSPGRSWTT